jgi:transposase
MLAVHVTAANEQDRRQVGTLAHQVQEVTGDAVELAYVDQRYTGESAAQAAQAHHMQREVVQLSEAKKGFVLLPKRWVVERSNAWAARLRRLARDYAQLAETLKGLHVVACAILMRKRFVDLLL